MLGFERPVALVDNVDFGGVDWDHFGRRGGAQCGRHYTASPPALDGN